MHSIVLRASGWLQREVDAAPLVAFRRSFALIWLVYDSFDLLLSGTSLCAWWATTTIVGAPLGLQLLQAALIACEALLWTGRRASLVALVLCGLRLVEQFAYFALNDFLYYIVTAAWLAFAVPIAMPSESASPAGSQRQSVPAWVRDGLVIQTGWIYLASATLKLNPAFLSGDHFWVRHAYMIHVLRWPYPPFLHHWLLSSPVNAVLASLTVISEALLGTLLVLRRGRPVALALVLGIHGFAAIAMNVVFFGASLIAQVWCLFPRKRADR